MAKRKGTDNHPDQISLFPASEGAPAPLTTRAKRTTASEKPATTRTANSTAKPEGRIKRGAKQLYRGAADIAKESVKGFATDNIKWVLSGGVGVVATGLFAHFGIALPPAAKPPVAEQRNAPIILPPPPVTTGSISTNEPKAAPQQQKRRVRKPPTPVEKPTSDPLAKIYEFFAPPRAAAPSKRAQPPAR